MTDSIKFKLVQCDDIRKVRLNATTTHLLLNMIKERAEASYKIVPGAYQLKYYDSDHDLVSLIDEEDLDEYLLGEPLRPIHVITTTRTQETPTDAGVAQEADIDTTYVSVTSPTVLDVSDAAESSHASSSSSQVHEEEEEENSPRAEAVPVESAPEGQEQEQQQGGGDEERSIADTTSISNGVPLQIVSATYGSSVNDTIDVTMIVRPFVKDNELHIEEGMCDSMFGGFLSTSSNQASSDNRRVFRALCRYGDMELPIARYGSDSIHVTYHVALQHFEMQVQQQHQVNEQHQQQPAAPPAGYIFATERRTAPISAGMPMQTPSYADAIASSSSRVMSPSPVNSVAVAEDTQRQEVKESLIRSPQDEPLVTLAPAEDTNTTTSNGGVSQPNANAEEMVAENDEEVTNDDTALVDGSAATEPSAADVDDRSESGSVGSMTSSFVDVSVSDTDGDGQEEKKGNNLPDIKMSMAFIEQVRATFKDDHRYRDFLLLGYRHNQHQLSREEFGAKARILFAEHDDLLTLFNTVFVVRPTDQATSLSQNVASSSASALEESNEEVDTGDAMTATTTSTAESVNGIEEPESHAPVSQQIEESNVTGSPVEEPDNSLAAVTNIEEQEEQEQPTVSNLELIANELQYHRLIVQTGVQSVFRHLRMKNKKKELSAESTFGASDCEGESSVVSPMAIEDYVETAKEEVRMLVERGEDVPEPRHLSETIVQRLSEAGLVQADETSDLMTALDTALVDVIHTEEEQVAPQRKRSNDDAFSVTESFVMINDQINGTGLGAPNNSHNESVTSTVHSLNQDDIAFPAANESMSEDEDSDAVNEYDDDIDAPCVSRSTFGSSSSVAVADVTHDAPVVTRETFGREEVSRVVEEQHRQEVQMMATLTPRPRAASPSAPTLDSEDEDEENNEDGGDQEQPQLGAGVDVATANMIYFTRCENLNEEHQSKMHNLFAMGFNDFAKNFELVRTECTLPEIVGFLCHV